MKVELCQKVKIKILSKAKDKSRIYQRCLYNYHLKLISIQFESMRKGSNSLEILNSESRFGVWHTNMYHLCWIKWIELLKMFIKTVMINLKIFFFLSGLKLALTCGRFKDYQSSFSTLVVEWRSSVPIYKQPWTSVHNRRSSLHNKCWERGRIVLETSTV